MRLSDTGVDGGTALFQDAEMDNRVQQFKALVFGGASPLIGWSRTHRIGLNTAYLDGHVQIFVDPERRTTFFNAQGYNYASGAPLKGGVFDLD